MSSLSRTIRTSILLMPFLLTMSAVAQDPGPDSLSVTDRAYLAGKVYASALQYFAHWADLPDLDSDAAYRQYLDRVLSSDDRLAFGRATMEYLAGFHNSHTILLDRQLIGHGGPLPFAARYLANHWVISESWTPGLKTGDVLETIDGQPFEQFFSDRLRLISASTLPFARRSFFARLPASPLYPHPFAMYAHLFPERFVLGLAGGRQVAVDRHSITATQGLPPTEGRWLEPGKVAYIRIPSFWVPDYEKKAIELVDEFRTAAALIVDVRGNLGGSTPSELTSLLMNRPYRWWTESTPVAMPYFRLRAAEGKWEYQPFNRPDFVWRSGAQQPPPNAFAGRLVLLVDAGCHSACEDFVMPFKDNGRAVLVGETTAGSTGQPYVLDLGHDMIVLIGAKREMFPDGSRFEGIGIKPDLPISPAPDDIRQDRDVVLQAARKSLAGS